MAKLKLNDVAFLLILKLDSIDRLENAIMVSNYLANNLSTNIYVWEIGIINNGFFQTLKNKDVKYVFHQDYDPILHRTKYINQMVQIVKEPYIAIWDCDIIIPILQIKKSVDLLRNGCDFVYPYRKYFYDTSYEIRNIFHQRQDIEVLEKYSCFMNRLYAPNPVGGVFFANKASYSDSGLEQEAFYGWGVEDGERYNRWIEQKRNVQRIEGCLYHLTHSRGINSHINSESEDIYKKRLYYSTKRGIL